MLLGDHWQVATLQKETNTVNKNYLIFLSEASKIKNNATTNF